MKKVLIILVLFMFVGTPAFSKEFKNPVDYITRFWLAHTDVNALIDRQTQKIETQQMKFEADVKARDKQIKEDQKARKEAFDIQQKKLKDKREQLRKLLEK